MANSVILNIQATKTDTILITARSMPPSSSIKETTVNQQNTLEDLNQVKLFQLLVLTNLAPNLQAISKSRAISIKICSLSRWITRNQMLEETLYKT